VDPGTVLSVEGDGTMRTRRYWQLAFPPDGAARRVSRAEAAATVRSLVTDAVARRLVSDVPLGAFLSGGIDSTIVVGVMSQLLTQPVKTFCIGFEGDAAFDETAIARATARRLRTDHTEFRVTPSAIDLLPALVAHHDGPFADSSAIPTYLVSKLTREHVTVALNGDGGDEVFAGYLRFGAAVAAERVPAVAAQAANAAVGLLPSPPNERHWTARVRRFARYAELPLDDRLVAWAGVFYDDLERLLGESARGIDRRTHLRPGVADPRWSPLSRLLAANFHSYLHDDLLVKADRMSMANSLEARSPFLDRALIDYVATLPDHFKTHGSRTKIILREAFADLLPAEVADRGKTGFGVPLDAWFRGGLRDYVRDVLLSPSARSASYLSMPYVRRLVDEHAEHRANHGHRLWTLLTFENWLQQLPSWRAGSNMRAAN
jgi:asparagine synthase (glutamine-hydrolysing)